MKISKETQRPARGSGAKYTADNINISGEYTKKMLSDEEILNIIDTSRKQARLNRIKSIMKDADEIHKEITKELRRKEK